MAGGAPAPAVYGVKALRCRSWRRVDPNVWSGARYTETPLQATASRNVHLLAAALVDDKAELRGRKWLYST